MLDFYSPRNHWNRDWSIRSNLLNIWSKTWKRSPTKTKHIIHRLSKIVVSISMTLLAGLVMQPIFPTGAKFETICFPSRRFSIDLFSHPQAKGSRAAVSSASPTMICRCTLSLRNKSLFDEGGSRSGGILILLVMPFREICNTFR